jgi:SnoaL-like domain
MNTPIINSHDELEIRNLVSRYCVTTDNADADGFMQCWVSPAEFGGYQSGPFGAMATWQEMYAFEKHHVGPGGMANGKRHQSTNVLIEPISDREVHVTHDLVVLEVAEVPRIVATGRYDKSVVVRTEHGWRFKSRTLHVDHGFFVATQGQAQPHGQGSEA